MTMDAYREMAGAALRATRQRGDAVMARYFGDAALAALAGRMRLLRHMAALRVSSLYRSPQPRADLVDPTIAVPSGWPRSWGGVVHPMAGIGLRSVMAVSAGALGHLFPDNAIIGKTPVSSVLSRQARAAAASPSRSPLLRMQTKIANAASGRAATIFGGLAIDPDLRARANNKPAVGHSYAGTRLIARRLIPVIRAVSAASAQAANGAVQTPGFGQTVRPSAGGQTAGDVYLDKNLVGYHLAAAITAEQTRAAARPNISGSAFNSSMAALRPSGAGS